VWRVLAYKFLVLAESTLEWNLEPEWKLGISVHVIVIFKTDGTINRSATSGFKAAISRGIMSLHIIGYGSAFIIVVG
jgi:hypothetical protein